ncbi:N-acetylmuramoyl-L-alanine amidase [Actinoplanes sp. NPDC049118]|uniref:peptidoglycan recognition protein family protein n=1 Tax=Actinoplanes sp. NPDC049118 TaxID=3155769 RepID=UPI0033CEF64A
MARLTWLADELRKAGLRVVEVDGWKTRGSTDFDPIGVTWHATAGSRTSTAQGEVNVILHGSATAPPPIAQIMAYRDGTLYLCAAGRCNHNKVGWAGPNKGLGNTRLLGIEMANDNRGEPWPAAQLDAVRRATAVIMRRLGADPMKRLAAHYEHQPYEGRPPGEGSTKSDPYGVVMTKERPRVAAIMEGDDVTKSELHAWLTEWARSAAGREALAVAVLTHDPGLDADGDVKPGGVANPDPVGAKTNPTFGPNYALNRAVVGTALGYQVRDRVDAVTDIVRVIAANVAADDADLPTILARLDESRASIVGDVLEGITAAGRSNDDIAAALRAALGDRAAAVGQLLAA